MRVNAREVADGFNGFLRWLIEEGLDMIFDVVGVFRGEAASGIGDDVAGATRTNEIAQTEPEPAAVDPKEPRVHKHVGEETVATSRPRLTKDRRRELLAENEGFTKETYNRQRNFREARTYKIEDGELHVRASGRTSWSDSRYKDKEWVADEGETHRFLRKHRDELDDDGIEPAASSERTPSDEEGIG
jgi:hypothetical protein